MTPVGFRRRGDVREVIWTPPERQAPIAKFGAICCTRCDGTGLEPGQGITAAEERPECLACRGDGFIDDPTDVTPVPVHAEPITPALVLPLVDEDQP